MDTIVSSNCLITRRSEQMRDNEQRRESEQADKDKREGNQRGCPQMALYAMDIFVLGKVSLKDDLGICIIKVTDSD